MGSWQRIPFIERKRRRGDNSNVPSNIGPNESGSFIGGESHGGSTIDTEAKFEESFDVKFLY